MNLTKYARYFSFGAGLLTLLLPHYLSFVFFVLWAIYVMFIDICKTLKLIVIESIMRLFNVIKPSF
jgi:cellulose synthase/poly-beta-1,6-N-acetylglucosamine synthase-like glycosyltransferase